MVATLEDALALIGATDDIGVLRKIRLEADKAIKKQRQPKAVAYHFSGWSMSAAQGLWMVVKDHYPFTPEPNLGQWADDIDKLQRIDNFAPELVQYVIKWSQNDSFWRQQVRSGANLRKHFTQMLVRIKEEQSNRKAVSI